MPAGELTEKAQLGKVSLKGIDRLEGREEQEEDVPALQPRVSRPPALSVSPNASPSKPTTPNIPSPKSLKQASAPKRHMSSHLPGFDPLHRHTVLPRMLPSPPAWMAHSGCGVSVKSLQTAQKIGSLPNVQQAYIAATRPSPQTVPGIQALHRAWNSLLGAEGRGARLVKPQVLCAAPSDLPSVTALARGESLGLAHAAWPSETVRTLSSAWVQAAVGSSQVGTNALPRRKSSGLALPLAQFLVLLASCKQYK